MRICNKCRRDETQIKFWNVRRGGKNTCTECHYVKKRAWRQKLRLDALNAYSGNQPKCACPGCDENRLPFLVLDHINNDGAAHRRSLSGPNNKTPEQPGAHAVWYQLKKLGYPPGYRVLCYNCNTARGLGKCPVHEPEDLSALETGY